MANLLLSTYKKKISSLELIPSDGGCFELKVGDELVYSKLGTDQFPDEARLAKEVGAKIG